MKHISPAYSRISLHKRKNLRWSFKVVVDKLRVSAQLRAV